MELGGFGTSRVAGPRRGGGRKLMNAVMLIVLIALLPAAYDGWSELYVNFLERELPEIRIPDPPPGLGVDPIEIAVQVNDQGSGLDEVIIRGEQDGNVRELLRKDYTGPKQHEDTLKIPLAGRDSGFEEGDFRITVLVFDRSFWTNGRTTTIDLSADYTKPNIEVITTQHNAALGGAELVFYRVAEKANVFSGVKAGRWLFPGFPAMKLDPDFEAQPDVHFAFFPIPIDFDPQNDTIRVFARDGVGNLATAGIYYRVQTIRYPREEMSLTEEFLRTKTAELLPGYLRLNAKIKGQPEEKLPPAETPEDLVRYFKLVNEDYRGLIERSLATLFSRPKVQRLWSGEFSRMAGANRAPFGERRHYVFNGMDAGQSMHMGVDLASTAYMPVTASNSGIVIFADDLGIYGRTVILDHGFGLYTLYGHLSAMQVAEGDNVTKGQVIAKSGSTGLAGGDHLHFEVRLHGIPVRPIEWWDGKWLADHIDRKIMDTKKLLGIKTSVPLT